MEEVSCVIMAACPTAVAMLSSWTCRRVATVQLDGPWDHGMLAMSHSDAIVVCVLVATMLAISLLAVPLAS